LDIVAHRQTRTHTGEDMEMEGISGDDDGGSCEGGEGVDDIASRGPLDEELGHQPAEEVYEGNEGEDSNSKDSNENSSDEETDFEVEDDGFDNLSYQHNIVRVACNKQW
jgi:hypothetical protein